MNNHRTKNYEENSVGSDDVQFDKTTGEAIPVLKERSKTSSKFKTIFRGTEFVRNLIPKNINDFEFIYDVNFNAGRVKSTFVRGGSMIFRPPTFLVQFYYSC